MSPVAADTVHPTFEADNSTAAAATNVIKASNGEAEPENSSETAIPSADETAENPIASEADDPTQETQPKFHTDDWCSGAYCNIVLPHPAHPIEPTEEAPVASQETAENPIASEADDSTQETQPKFHTDDWCSGAYCNIVLPHPAHPIEPTEEAPVASQ
ncbi:hypothetical protein CALVIDRAFT_526033 [Calocera viscosa TUFC12733]|uniref:Uncharacterized protein n=1 Tax=Calocera viscosa (strain TUFC12733) TaxID=1330018 RepID=A0A167PAZ4_CALVF|nr:hypothetical protein CALVIDRAFT_526033 [Calocera viscosa TUFC12733]